METSDIYYAAYLISHDIAYDKIEFGRSRAVFTFDDSARVSRLGQGFFTSGGVVSGRNMAWTIRILKSLIFKDLCADHMRPQTPDLYFAAFLMTIGAELIGKVNVDRKTMFEFAPMDEELMSGYIKAYVMGSATCSASDMCNNIKTLKSYLYSDRRS